MDWLADPQAWMALATLTVLEVVLGIDNIVFIAIVADKLPETQRAPGAYGWLRLGHADAHCVVILAQLGHAADCPPVCRAGV